MTPIISVFPAITPPIIDKSILPLPDVSLCQLTLTVELLYVLNVQQDALPVQISLIVVVVSTGTS